MTANDLRALQRMGYSLGRDCLQANQVGSQVSHPKPKRNQKAALGSVAEREEKIVGRISLKFVLYRVRPLDPDGAAGSTKDLIDGLREANLLPEDDPWTISLQVEQVKVSHYSEERTELEIIYP